jgi:phage terminase Nu1 subunit (DNA packaging protein)
MAVMSCWKQIAEYLGTSVRTSQRWEREQGLPVRRNPELEKATVFAIPDELDQWIRSRHPRCDELEALRKEVAELRALLRQYEGQAA